MIPVCEPLLADTDIDHVTRALRSGWISSAGEYLEQFEEQWAEYCGRRFGIAMCNGSAALHASVACLRLEPGDEVLVPSFTIISCVQAILYAGATPVLVDCDPRTWNLDPQHAASRVTPRTRAIMPVHIYGHPVDMDAILAIADHHGLAVIEDAAEAHGAEYLTDRHSPHAHWRRCGSFGDMSCFSFYSNKIITTGEGGMVLTDDPELAERLRAFRNLCFQPGRRFLHAELGHNFRMTNLQAAVGVGQVPRIGALVARKRRIAVEYTRRLRALSTLQLPAEEAWARSVYWMYGVVVAEESGLTAETLAAQLRKRGVETRPFFLGMHEQPALRARGLFALERYPVTERLARRGLYLPSGLGLTDTQINRVCNALREVLS